ncbi:dapper homolog 3-like isoform X2 [Carassius carassius]|uniref:dapper homolog 3-like isoform X2 n=1 Tax=Carassius carassius TaxID=217509 RepID=UPI002868DDC4|nr:dapper homolog 3-like isoform X2 [Carassius carassius]
MMFRVFSLAAAERGRQKRRLELSLAGICELELLKRRHEAMITGALALHAPEPEPEPERAERPSDDTSSPDGSWSLISILQHQVGELKLDSGSAERRDDSSDVFVGRELVTRSLHKPCLLLEGVPEDETWIWHPSEDAEEEDPSIDDYRQTQRTEAYILGLIQRRSPPSRPNKPRTSVTVVRQSSLSHKDPPYVPDERHAWDEACSILYPRPALAGIRSTSSEAESPQHFYQHERSPSSEELVNAQYIPAQATAHRTHRTHASPKPASSQLRAAAKKCRFTEDKIAPKKPRRKTCRAQSENSLREPKYNTVERDAVRSAPPKTRRGSGHRRWRSTLELSQDEAETPPEQPIRRSRRPRVYTHLHHHHHHHQPQLQDAGDSESSLSEADSPGSSSLSCDSDESSGLVWPQQLRPQLAPPSPSHPPQPKAFVKIKASHALKKKILRFRSGSLKVMTTV